MTSYDKGISGRSEEVVEILGPVVTKLTDFLARADADVQLHQKNDINIDESSTNLLQESLAPEELSVRIARSLQIPENGLGKNGLLDTVDDILRYSVNTTCPGFMDKLYGSALPPGVAAELILSVLNTNLHVYQVSPVLTLIEKRVTHALATMFGFDGARAGGISVQGGSASNLTSIVAARNCLFPHTKTRGNVAESGGKMTLFTSAHGHYSIEKAAQALGFGSQNVISVPVDRYGRMLPDVLERLMGESKSNGFTPFYINATAGSTVLGSFDPFDAIADVAQRYHCWLHVDGAWGGSFVFAGRTEILNRLSGIGRADSMAINPHKMLGVPLTCSFLLTRDLRLFQAAMTLRAGYLFHDNDEDMTGECKADDSDKGSRGLKNPNELVDDQENVEQPPFDTHNESSSWTEPYDLADLTLQCGRRGDALKFFLSWQYYGTEGYRAKIENAYDIALGLARSLDRMRDFRLVLGEGSQPECLQVCFYYTPNGEFVYGTDSKHGQMGTPGLGSKHEASLIDDMIRKQTGRYNTMVTSRISKALISRGFMIDFAPALDGQEEKGSFFRVVVNVSTIKETTDRLIQEILDTGKLVVQEIGEKYR